MSNKRSQFTLALVGIIAVGIIVLSVGLFVWSRQQIGVREAKAHITALEDEITTMERKINQRKELEGQLATLQEELRALDHDLPDYKYMPTYLVELQRKALATGNELISINPSDIKPFDPAKSPFAPPPPPRAEGGTGEGGSVVTDSGADADRSAGGKKKKKVEAPTDLYQRINLDITGSYPSIMRFLEALRGFHKLVYVRTVQLSPVREKNALIGMNAQIETIAIITPEQFKKIDPAASQGAAPAPREPAGEQPAAGQAPPVEGGAR